MRKGGGMTMMQRPVQTWHVIIAVVLLVAIVGALGWFWLRPRTPKEVEMGPATEMTGREMGKIIGGQEQPSQPK